MTPHYIVVLNRTELLVYRLDTPVGRTDPNCVLVEAMDFPIGRQQYTDTVTDFAGRHPRGADNNSSIDERLPMQEEHERRQTGIIAAMLEKFLQAHPHIRWDYAAGPQIHYAVLDRLSPEARGGLERAIQKDLTKIPANELLQHFPAHAGY